MTLPFFIRSLLILTLGTCPLFASAQKETTDSVLSTHAGMVAKSDELYFDAIKAKMHDDPKQAQGLLEQFIAKRPEVSAAYYELSKLSYNEKKTDQAIAYVRKAIDLSPENKWYKEQYATILADKGEYAEAAHVVEQLFKADPTDRTYPLMAAEYFDRAHKYDEALTYLDKALQQVGMDEDVMGRKVQVYLEMNNVPKAAEVMQQLIAHEPRNGKYYKLLGELYDTNKMPEKATELYKRALKALPEDPTIQLGIAEHYLKMGDTTSYIDYVKKAIVNKDLDIEAQVYMLQVYVQSLPNDSSVRAHGLPIIRQLVNQHPDDPQVLEFYAGFLEINSQHDSAMWVYKRSLALKPANFKAWEKLLGSYTDKNDADSLMKYSEKVMRLFPNQAEAHYFNSIAHYNKKDYPGAIKAMNRAIDLVPESNKEQLGGFYAFLGDIYHTNRQDDLSDEAFEAALKMQPNDATLLNNYSYYLSERGKRLDDAEKMSKHSLELRPDQATFLDTYGWILYKKGNIEKAREYVQKAVDLSGAKADATLFDHLGNIYFKLNDKDKALQYWKLSKEKGNEDPAIDKKIKEVRLYE